MWKQQPLGGRGDENAISTIFPHSLRLFLSMAERRTWNLVPQQREGVQEKANPSD